jgi:hypothetical protein
MGEAGGTRQVRSTEQHTDLGAKLCAPHCLALRISIKVRELFTGVNPTITVANNPFTFFFLAKETIQLL